MHPSTPTTVPYPPLTPNSQKNRSNANTPSSERRQTPLPLNLASPIPLSSSIEQDRAYIHLREMASVGGNVNPENEDRTPTVPTFPHREEMGSGVR
jgi:hypothetical protein